MKIAIAGFALESVSFLPVETGLADFESIALRGYALIEGLRGTASVGGGFIDVLEDAGVEIMPLVYTDCSAAGPASDEAFEFYRDEIANGLRRERRSLDGVLLYLHGAMTTPTRPDPETELLRAVRTVVGHELPLVVAFDLHANLSEDSAVLCTALCGFHYSPHTDMDETGRRAARMLLQSLQGEARPQLTFVKVPVVLPSICTATALPPLCDIVAAGLAAVQSREDVLDVSVFCGFAYADVPPLGFSVAVVTDGAPDTGRAIAGGLADQIWREREALLGAVPVHSAHEGVSRAIAMAAGGDGPVVLLEHADRMNDSTWVLKELLDQNAPSAAVPYLWDPEGAEAALRAGVGATVSLGVGGRSSDRAGGPAALTGQVLYAEHKTYVGTGPMRRGRRIDLGPAALIDASGILVSLTSRPTTAIDEDPFTQFGLAARDFDIIVLRSKTHFRAVYEKLAREILVVDTPDWGPADLTKLPFRRVRPGVFPVTAPIGVGAE
ncbi:MAG: M81 family metallopeptidase [Rhodospirillales bacterium]|nr:MAG: M81 family metallopeptidase [Rhodospirillales bacterium]